jgi:hypothetical protein
MFRIVFVIAVACAAVYSAWLVPIPREIEIVAVPGFIACIGIGALLFAIQRLSLKRLDIGGGITGLLIFGISCFIFVASMNLRRDALLYTELIGRIPTSWEEFASSICLDNITAPEWWPEEISPPEIDFPEFNKPEIDVQLPDWLK